MAIKPIAQKLKYRNDLTAEFVRSILDYIPESGELIWKYNPKKTKQLNARDVGRRAGNINSTGHRQVEINGVAYTASRLIWLIQTGEWPPRQVDHKDTDSLNDRWANFRLATNQQNCCNRKRRYSNKSGYKGVHAYRKRFVAQINGKHIGVFNTPEEAHAAYCEEAKKLHGKFANFG